MHTTSPTKISHQLGTWLTRVEHDESIPSNIRLDMGLFLDRVVELVEQAFREVLRLSITLKFMTDADLTADRIREYQQRVEQLRARDRYRDVDFVCGRLHVLRSEFEAYREFTKAFGDDFHELMWMIDEREGAIIDLVQGFVGNLVHRLGNIASAPSLDRAKELRDKMVEMIDERTGELEASIGELTQIHNRILPMLGESEFLSVLSGREPSPTVNIVDQRVDTGGGDYVHGNLQKAGRDFVQQSAGRDLAGRDVITHSGPEPSDLDEARKVLHEAVLNFPEDRRATIQKQIDKVIDGITAKSRPSALQEKAHHLEMFLESGKHLLSDAAKSAWSYVKGMLPGKKRG
jgi:hypothetical protein